jgi:hypothetical protein
MDVRPPDTLTPAGDVFLLRLQMLPGSPVPTAVQLRHTLKRLLRDHHLRCLSIEQVPPAAEGQAEADTAPGRQPEAR